MVYENYTVQDIWTYVLYDSQTEVIFQVYFIIVVVEEYEILQ